MKLCMKDNFYILMTFPIELRDFIALYFIPIEMHQ